jgi:hypothetical protein
MGSLTLYIKSESLLIFLAHITRVVALEKAIRFVFADNSKYGDGHLDIDTPAPDLMLERIQVLILSGSHGEWVVEDDGAHTLVQCHIEPRARAMNSAN